METQNSFSELIDKFILLQNNALSIIQKINEAVISDNDNITFTLKDMNAAEVTYNFPSFGYLKENLDRIDSTLKSLMGIDGGETIMRMPDGTYKRVITAKLAKEPEDILSLTVPGNFGVKPNWFFESFLSPAMFITFDVSKYIEQSAKRIVCKRVITVCDNLDKETYFDLKYKGKNDIDIDVMYTDLANKGILYYEDEEVKDLPLSILQYEGSFDVINIKDVQTTSIDGVVKTVRQYVLNKLTYNDSLTKIDDSLMLKIGDKIICKDTIYEISAVDASTNAIVLVRLSGYDSIQIGVGTIRIYSDTFAAKTADVGISFNEREIIFFKSIEETNNIVAKNWSPGIGIFTNDLTILTTAGNQNLKTFYNDNVLDFSKAIMAIAKEKNVPSIYGEIPDAPLLDVTNFKVLRINDHLFDSKVQEDIKKKGADKVQLSAEIKQLEAAIEKNKQILGNTNFKTDQERSSVKNKLDSLIKEKTSKSSLYASIVTELNSIARDNNITFDKPKYHARAFFDIPNPKTNDNTGAQEVIQFEYAYRYLRTDGKPAQVKQLEYKSKNNQTKRGTFSSWVYVKSDIRKRYYDYQAGIYKWAGEDVENGDVVNINQIDIPISKGEKVEVRIRSYSEAGWPINPIISEWSTSVIVEFPVELNATDESELALQQSLNEEAQVKFEETLRSKNLDLHLATSTQTGDNYIAHNADAIASGFFTDAGIVINLYEKIKLLESEIKNLRNILEKKKGTLRVAIIEDGPKTIKNYIKNGSVVDLFAGYYTDFIDQLSTNEKKGAIITKVYKFVLENTEKTPLELLSFLPGGLSERLPEQPLWTNSDREYFEKLKYWEVPLNNLSVATSETKNANGIYAGNVQSRQLCSQYTYLRKHNIGLVTPLYKEPVLSSDRYLVPLTMGTDHPSWVWNWSFDGSNQPIGGGSLTDFCVHVDCPLLISDNDSDWTFNTQNPPTDPDIAGITWEDFFNTPLIDIDNNMMPLPSMKMSAFRHSAYFNLESTAVDGLVQLSFKDPWFYNHSTSASLPITDSQFTGQYGATNKKYEPVISELPDKLGFFPHDRYLIGKNTCGSYLYMAPAYFDQLLVAGADYKSVKTVDNGEENSLVIPIVYQFRMSDYYGTTAVSGKIGGDATNKTKNLVYNKKLGIDIYVKDNDRFSFDVSVSSKYSKKTQAEKIEITQNVAQKPSSIKTSKTNLSTL
jgi:hypothetical protein